MSVPNPLKWLYRVVPVALGVIACGENVESEAPCAIAPLATCVADYSDALAACYSTAGAACADDDADTTAALDALADGLGDCTVAGLDADATVGRLQNACASEAEAMAWRAMGGPQGAALALTANDNQVACLTSAHAAAAELAEASLTAIADCYAEEDCDPADVASRRDELRATATSTVDAACPLLPNLVGIDVATFVDRADLQVDCLTAAGWDAPSDLGLECGPSYAQFDAPARGEWTQIPVDREIWGAQCADGSDYSFWVYLAPEGEPLDQVVVGLQGGGVCIFEGDCASRLESDPQLFTASDDEPLEIGITSNDPNVSPFATWTKVYLPYCNQDVFAGGGVDEDLGSVTIPRYGGVNLRAAMRMFRDVLWREMDAEGGAGFRSDEIVTLFGGFSAGGYGTLYNYHWVIDELLWPRTAAFPDAGLALDSGGVESVRGLGLVKIPAWGAQLPSYCFGPDCAVGEDMMVAMSPRLLQVPEQQVLPISNQHDVIQQRDAFFSDTPSFINEMRASYCRTRDLPGVQWYLTSVSSEPVHVVTIREERWLDAVDGEVMSDWFARAVDDPATLVDRVEEGDFVTAIDGVEPFPCELP